MRKTSMQLAVRVLRRRLQLATSGQARSRHEQLSRQWTRLVWIHEGMPQVGDALMDLAPRSLLVEQGFVVDLWAPPHLAALFDGDPWFGSVWPSNASPLPEEYDAALLLSDDRRSLKLKRRWLVDLPWLSIQGLYNGPDFHRAAFTTQRLLDALGLALPLDEFWRHARQKLVPSTAAQSWASGVLRDRRPVAVALGGVDPARTYAYWPEVVQMMARAGLQQFVLLGNTNARETALHIGGTLADDNSIIDLVGRTTLQQASALMARCALVVCADGGLMHLAIATETPLCALFSGRVSAEWRHPVGRPYVLSLVAPTGAQVSSIAPALVAAAALKLANR